MSGLKIYLLTHEKELDRNTSTSRVVKEVIKDRCEIITWKRKEPDFLFKEELSPENSILVYKSEEGVSVEDIEGIKNFILLEGTWQESRKIYNRSPYLKQYKVLSIKPNSPSKYNLRRNQVASGLSTVETVIEIFRLKRENDVANTLFSAFINFQSPSRD